MDLVKTLLVYMMVLVGSATQASPDVTPIPANMIFTPTPIVTPSPTPSPTPVLTAVPTKTPTIKPSGNYTTLYVGDKGTNVRKLQQRLQELGYLKDKVDGAYGQNTKKAVEAFQKNNGLKVDGIAGKATQTILFESTAVVPAGQVTPTPTATASVLVNVPVYYVESSTGRVLARSTSPCRGTTNVYPDSALMGAYIKSGYVLDSSASVTVRVTNGVALPSSVTFYYAAPVSSPTPTAAPEMVYIPVYYVSTDGTMLNTSTAVIRCGTVTTVTYDPDCVPYGYTLSSSPTSNVRVTGNGVAVPSSVTFYLRKMNTVTPSPTPKATLPYNVYYVDEYNNLLYQETLYLTPTRQTVYANRGNVPGYKIVGATSVTVTYSRGAFSPSMATFTCEPTYVTPTPTPRPTRTPKPTNTPKPTATREPQSVYIYVYYRDQDNQDIAARVRTLCTPGVNNIEVDWSNVPENYTLIGLTSQEVFVDQSGATPSEIIFNFSYEAPQPVPVEVPVLHVDQGGNYLIEPYTEVCQPGENTVYADLSRIPEGYSLYGGSEYQCVFVNENGADPATVTFVFNYVAPQPVPVDVPVYHVDQDGNYLIEPYTEVCQPGENTVYADLSRIPEGYSLYGGSEYQYVFVDENGADPATVTFVFNYIAPQPVPVDVPVYHVDQDGNYLIEPYTEVCQPGENTVYADLSRIPEGYSLYGGSEYQYVFVDENGADPSSVTFCFVYEEPQPVITGGSVTVNGNYGGEWYQADGGYVMIEPRAFVSALGINYEYRENGMAATIRDCEVVVDGLNATVDNVPTGYTEYHNDDVYVSLDLFDYTGMIWQIEGSDLNVYL